jgi:DedD protein
MVSVLVGPDLKKDKLEARLPELQQLSQVSKLKVSSYQPVENN